MPNNVIQSQKHNANLKKKKARLQSLHTAQFHLYETLEKEGL